MVRELTTPSNGALISVFARRTRRRDRAASAEAGTETMRTGRRNFSRNPGPARGPGAGWWRRRNVVGCASNCGEGVAAIPPRWGDCPDDAGSAGKFPIIFRAQEPRRLDRVDQLELHHPA